MKRGMADWLLGADAARTEQLLADWVEMGAMSGDEARDWEHAARAEAGQVGVGLSDEVRARAERLLAGAPEVMDSQSDEYLGRCGALTALHLLTAVPVEESAGWFRRLASHAVYRPVAPEVLAMQQANVAAGEFRGARLLRVLPGPVVREREVRIVSVELYDDGVGVVWHKLGEWPRSRAWAGTAVAVSDDRGTDYIGRGGGASRLGFDERRLGEAIRGRDVFVPAPPRNATQLLVDYEDARFTIAL